MAKRNTKSGNTLTYETLPELFTGICDAIRAKDGTSADINHQDIPAKIATLSGGTLLKNYIGVGSSVNPSSEMADITADGSTYAITLCIGNYTTEISLTKNGDTVAPKAGQLYTFPPGTTSKYTIKTWEVSTSNGDVLSFSAKPTGLNGGCILTIVKY